MSAQSFLKDFKDYFVDLELTEFDEQRLTGIFERNIPVTVVERPKIVYKEIVKERVVYRDIVPIVQRKMIEMEKLYGERERLFNQICEYWALPYSKVRSPCREQPLVYCRCHSFFIFREMGMTLKEIGNYFERDHTTVLHGLQAVADWIETKSEPFYSMFINWQEKSLQPVPGTEEDNGVLPRQKEDEKWPEVVSSECVY